MKTINVILIGDVHGKLDNYLEILESCTNGYTYCVGDVGFQSKWEILKSRIPIIENQHYINMGNHDYTPYKNCYLSTGDFRWDSNTGVFTVRGAASIDRSHRCEGYDWFRDEELNFTESSFALEEYEKHKPDIVVSHDCPDEVCKKLFGYTDKNSTRALLQEMLNLHRPKIWVFGHHHKDVSEIFSDEAGNSTEFICLNELSHLSLELNLTDEGKLLSVGNRILVTSGRK